MCGAVRYECRAPLRPVVNCHCRMCRRTHGHVAAYAALARNGLAITGNRSLKWYASSAHVRRGFCSHCGASLFWAPADEAYVAVSAGTLDPPSGLSTIGHVFTADGGDYYDICDGLERFPGSMRNKQHD